MDKRDKRDFGEYLFMWVIGALVGFSMGFLFRQQAFPSFHHDNLKRAEYEGCRKSKYGTIDVCVKMIGLEK